MGIETLAIASMAMGALGTGASIIGQGQQAAAQAGQANYMAQVARGVLEALEQLVVGPRFFERDQRGEARFLEFLRQPAVWPRQHGDGCGERPQCMDLTGNEAHAAALPRFFRHGSSQSGKPAGFAAPCHHP